MILSFGDFAVVAWALFSIISVSLALHCEQFLFSSKIRGKERKTSKSASVTVSVTWERRCREPLVACASGDARKERPTNRITPSPESRAFKSSRSQSRSHSYLFCVQFPRIFEEKRDCKQSILARVRVLRRVFSPTSEVIFHVFLVDTAFPSQMLTPNFHPRSVGLSEGPQ